MTNANVDILYSKFPWTFCFLYIFVDLAISLKIVYGIQENPVTIRLFIISMPNMVYFVRTRPVSPTQIYFIFLFTLRADFNLTLTVPADRRVWLGAGRSSNTSAHSKYADIKISLDIDNSRCVFDNKRPTGPHER